MLATSSPSDRLTDVPASRPARFGRVDLLVVAAACGLSLAATLPRLTRRPVWTDEGLTVGATTQLFDTLRGTGGTMALYYAVITPIAQLSTDRFWIRLPSALFVAATVAVTYLVARRIGGRWLAATSSLVLASTWALARWGIEARGYGLAMLLVAVGWLGVVELGATDDPRRRRRGWVLLAVGGLLGPLAHGLAALQLVAQAAVLVARADRRRFVRPLLVLGLAWAVLLLVLFAYGAGEVASWIEPPTWSDLKQVYAMLVGRGGLGVAVGAVVVAGTAIAAIRVVRGAPWRAGSTDVGADGWLPLVALAWAWGQPLAVLAISLVRPYQEPRYLVSSLPGVALLLGLAVTSLRGRPLRLGATAVLMAVLLSMQPAVTNTSGEDWPSVVAVLDAQAQPGDGLVMRPLLRAPFDYAVAERGGTVALEPVSPEVPIGEPHRIYGEPDGSLRQVLLDADERTVWVVVRGLESRDEVEALRDDPELAGERQIAQIQKLRGELAVYRFRLKERA